MRKFSITYRKEKLKEKHKLEKNLRAELQDLEEKLDYADKGNLKLVDKYEGVKHLLEELETEKAIGAMVRSRVRWYEEGEKSTKFFFNLEKHNYVRKFIRKLHTNDGYIVTNREEILEYTKNFYINLYSTREYDKDPSNKSYFWRTNTPKINDDNKLKCVKMLTRQECEDALKHLH